MSVDPVHSISTVREATENERGATIIMVAMSLVLLMGMAAVAVDSGIVFNDRRQQQSAADVGALAAIQFAKTILPSGNALCNAEAGIDYAACRGAEEALDVIDGTLPGRYSAADWLACTADPTPPAEFTQVSFISPCINCTNNLQKVRVVLPGTEVDTAFAGVIGFNSVRVNAPCRSRIAIEPISGRTSLGGGSHR